MEKQKNNKLHRQLFVSLRHHVGDSFIEKQRLLIYIYVSIGGGLLLILNLIGLSGPMGKYYFIANSINLFFITFLLLAFLRKYINLENAVIGLMSVCQLFCISEMLFILKSATKLFSVLLASKRPLITELADKLRLKYPLLPTISPCPTMRLEAIRSIIPISCRRYPKSV